MKSRKWVLCEPEDPSADRSSHRRRDVGGVVPFPAADLGGLSASEGRPGAAVELRGPGRRPVLHPQRLRADVELSRTDGTVLVDPGHPALPVAAAVAGVADLPRHHAHRRTVDHLHAARRHHAVPGRREAHGHQLRPAAVHGPAVVRAVLRRHQLGRTGLVDQCRVAGLPGVRPDDPGDLPDGDGVAGADPAAAGIHRLAAADHPAAGQRALLHAVELAAADRGAVPRRRVRVCGGPAAAPDRPRPAHRRLLRDCCSPPSASRSCTTTTRIR